MTIMKFPSGDGYSRMFEPSDPELDRQIAEQAVRDTELRDLLNEWLNHPRRKRDDNDFWLLLTRYSVKLTPDILRSAIAEIDNRVAREAERDARERERMASGERPERHQSLVYYMLMGTRVKIGTSMNLTGRLASVQPERLLAVEPGDYAVERQRHHEFAQWRTNGEWFAASDSVQEHVYRCADEYGDILAPWADWKPLPRGGWHGRRRRAAD